MPYPLVQVPTFAEFKKRLADEFGCEFKSETVQSRNNGTFFVAPYFERIVHGKQLTYSVSIENEDDRVTLHLIRSVCRRLEMDMSAFGLNPGLESDLSAST